MGVVSCVFQYLVCAVKCFVCFFRQSVCGAKIKERDRVLTRLCGAWFLFADWFGCLTIQMEGSNTAECIAHYCRIVCQDESSF